MCMNPAPPERGTRRDPAQRGGATLSMTGFLFCLAFAVTLAWAVCRRVRRACRHRSTGCTGIAAAGALAAQRGRSQHRPAIPTRLGRLALTSVLLSFFAGAGFALAIFHGSGHAVPTSPRGAQAIAGAAVLLDAVVVAVLLARSGRTTDIEERLRRWLVTVQCALPLLGLVLLPPQLSYQGSREPYVWPVTLLVLLLAYAVVIPPGFR